MIHEPGDYYRDYGDPIVERLARSVCRAWGADPDELVIETGYESAKRVPAWWKQQEHARAFLAMSEAMKENAA